MREFIASYDYDKRLALHDIKGSVAHVDMLARRKIIPAASASRIIRALKKISAGIAKGKKLPRAEDIHYAVEKEIIKRLGPDGGRMHTARSRNDQVVTDEKLWLKDEIPSLVAASKRLRKAILEKSRACVKAVMPGYTHLQQAQPVLFSHWLSAYNEMLKRDESRLADCLERLDESPLGSAAFAGTSFAIDRRLTARLLGFSRVCANSVDAVASRDFVCEFIAACAVLMTNLSRLAEDLIIFSSAEFGFVEMPDSFSSGSSIMPQKKNPDWLEIVRAKAASVVGDLTAVLLIVKGLPLAYNRDLQEDKIHLFRAASAVSGSLAVSAGVVSGLKINPRRMLASFRKDYLFATELADYLTVKGVPFRKAHGAVASAVSFAVSEGKRLADVPLAEYKKISASFGRDLYARLDPQKIVASKKSYGGTSPSLVARYIENEISKLKTKK